MLKRSVEVVFGGNRQVRFFVADPYFWKFSAKRRGGAQDWADPCAPRAIPEHSNVKGLASNAASKRTEREPISAAHEMRSLTGKNPCPKQVQEEPTPVVSKA